MALSKLSLSKNKVAKQPRAATPSTGSAAKPAAGTAGPKATSSASLLRILQNDSDWEDSSSDSEASQPAQGPPPAAVSSGGPGGARPAAPAARLLQRGGRPTVSAQPRPSGLCDLEVSTSSEEEDEARVPDAQPAGGGPQADLAQRAQQQPPAAPAACPGWHPRQQPDAKQPQHRKCSFDQAAAPAAGSGHPLPPPAAAAAARAAAAAAPAAAAVPAAGAPQPDALKPAQLSSEVPTKLPSEPSSASLGCSLAGGGEPSASSDADLPEYQAVKAWLQELGLCQYFELFVREEIDLTIVHALTTEDLASIGVTHRSHQQALVVAGQRLGAERRGAQQQQQQQQQQGWQEHQDWQQQAAAQAAQPAHPSRLGLAGAHALAPLQPAPRQQQHHPPVGGPQPGAKAKQAAGRGSHQSLLQVWQANSAAQAAAAAGSACDASALLQQHSGAGAAGEGSEQCESSEAHVASQTHAGTRPTERALLAALYPPQLAQAGRAAQAALVPGQQGVPPWARGQALRPSTAAGPAARVPAGATLWAAAGECRPVAAGMEERLNKRRADAGLEGAPQEKLARGGTAYPQVDESRALKVMKLEGLRQELAMHEETAAQLRRMIADMEAELGQSS